MNWLELIKAAREQRTAITTQMQTLVAAPTAENRSLTDDETKAFLELDAEARALDAQIETYDDARKREARAEEVFAGAGQTGERRSGGAIVTSPMTYGRGSRHSYFLDLARRDTNRGDGDGGVAEAIERIKRHAAEVDVELPKREARREQRAADQLERLGEESAFERRTNPNRTDGTGGYFVPPLWLVDEYVALQRAGRVMANSVRNLTLPAGTDSINVPKVATGTTTAAQTADAAAVSSTDLTDSTISAPVRTLAGQQDIAIQLLDQSPISFDEVVFDDLMRDYNTKLDQQVIYGTGSNGQAKGVYNVASIVDVTYTSSSPTLQEMYPYFAQTLSQMATARIAPPTAWFMHSRRWYWMLSQLDGTSGTAGRPMIVAAPAQPYNAAALQTGVEAEGPAGYLLGLPVMLDLNVQTTVSSTRDVVYALRTPDIYLWEGSMRSRTLTEILSGTLQVRLQVYNYYAVLADRYASSIGRIMGTGTAGPSGF